MGIMESDMLHDFSNCSFFQTKVLDHFNLVNFPIPTECCRNFTSSLVKLYVLRQSHVGIEIAILYFKFICMH